MSVRDDSNPYDDPRIVAIEHCILEAVYYAIGNVEGSRLAPFRGNGVVPYGVFCPKTFTVAEVIRRFGKLSHTTLHKYAKLAGVRTARRGERNFRFTEDELRQTLQAMIDLNKDQALADLAREVLRRLSNDR